jgi:hypothetical protein
MSIYKLSSWASGDQEVFHGPVQTWPGHHFEISWSRWDYFPTDAKGIWAELVKEADAKVRGSLELIFK